MMPTVTGLFVYPIKSCAAHEQDESPVDSGSLRLDRKWVIVSTALKVMTQRDFPRMALIRPQVQSDKLVLRANGMADLAISCTASGPTDRFDLWSEQCAGVDAGDEAANWLSTFLDSKVRLVATEESCQRTRSYGTGSPIVAKVGFSDVAPILVMYEESHQDLNSRLSMPVPMSRFRPSIVIRGLGNYSEDQKAGLDIDGVRLEYVAPCARCVVINIDQEAGEKSGSEPLDVLNSYRKDSGKAVIGAYYVARGEGRIRRGAVVRRD